MTQKSCQALGRSDVTASGDPLGVLVIIKLVTRNDIAAAGLPGMIFVHLQAGCEHAAWHSYTVHLKHTVCTQIHSMQTINHEHSMPSALPSFATCMHNECTLCDSQTSALQGFLKCKLDCTLCPAPELHLNTAARLLLPDQPKHVKPTCPHQQARSMSDMICKSQTVIVAKILSLQPECASPP